MNDLANFTFTKMQNTVVVSLSRYPSIGKGNQYSLAIIDCITRFIQAYPATKRMSNQSFAYENYAGHVS